MSSITLYTPGHHLITDSLIMHGIARYLTWAGVNIDSVKIRRLGDRFAIEINNPNPIREDEAKQILLTIQNQAVKGVLSGGDVYLTRFFEKIDAANLNGPAFKEWIRQFSQAITKFYFDSVRIYVNYNHKDESGEGYGRAGYPTLYLPLGPLNDCGVIEQVLHKDCHAARREGSTYKVCYTCFLFANLGLVYGSGVVRIHSNYNSITDMWAVSIMYTLIPPAEAGMGDVVLAQRMLENNCEVYDLEKAGADTALVPSIVEKLSNALADAMHTFRMNALVWALTWPYKVVTIREFNKPDPSLMLRNLHLVYMP
ncbi:MAG: hypothetical protein L7G96_06260 [Vulcanisaeta sp.]|nr:hypothetical protein [Vulcanisaeta sp.]